MLGHAGDTGQLEEQAPVAKQRWSPAEQGHPAQVAAHTAGVVLLPLSHCTGKLELQLLEFEH